MSIWKAHATVPPGEKRREGARRLAALVLAVSLPAMPSPAAAQAVPQHLSGLTGELLDKAQDSFAPAGLDPEQQAIAADAQTTLQQAGVLQWAAKDVGDSAMLATFGEELGAGRNSDPMAVNALFEADPSDLGALRKAALTFLKRRTDREPSESSVVELMLDVVAARTRALDPVSGKHRIDLEDGGFIELSHDAATGDFRVAIVQNGNIVFVEGEALIIVDDGRARIDVGGGPNSARLVTADDLAELYRQLERGSWFGSDGNSYEIWNDNTKFESRVDRLVWVNEQLPGLRKMVADSQPRRTGLWRSDTTGKEFYAPVSKTRPGAVLLGEVDIAPRVLAYWEQRLAELEAEAAAVPDIEAPSLTPSPVSRSVAITVTHPNGYKQKYLGQVVLDRIEARMRIKDVRDMDELPETVQQQIADTWQPERWIELKAVVNRKTGQIHLQGLWWSWNVTYDGDTYKVERIHTPFSEPLILTRQPLAKIIRFTDAKFVPVSEIGLYPGPPPSIRTGEAWVEILAAAEDPSFDDAIIEEIPVRVTSEINALGQRVVCRETEPGSRIFRSVQSVAFEQRTP